MNGQILPFAVMSEVAIKLAALEVEKGSPVYCDVTVKTDGEIKIDDVFPVETIEPTKNVDWLQVMMSMDEADGQKQQSSEDKCREDSRDYSTEGAMSHAAFVGILLGGAAVIGGMIALGVAAIKSKKR